MRLWPFSKPKTIDFVERPQKNVEGPRGHTVTARVGRTVRTRVPNWESQRTHCPRCLRELNMLTNECPSCHQVW